MRYIVMALGLVSLAACGAAPDLEHTEMVEELPKTYTRSVSSVTDRFAVLALDCIHREYPNKISHVMQSAADAKPPRELTPIFYGCFDWHSSVHGHWLLVRILNTSPDTQLAKEIRDKLAISFTADALAAELAYYTAAGRAAFERPYGIAWFLQLIAELEESDDSDLTAWRETLRPLEQAIVARTSDWLPKLIYPIRLGTHSQTAFAFGLMLDYARAVNDTVFEQALVTKIRSFHDADTNCPLAYEPSGEDFLSPCLMEADLMRRVMAPQEYARWLTGFLPDLPEDSSDAWLQPGIVMDASDGKLVHLDGLNLSRAWALEGVASGLPTDDPRIVVLMAAAELHKQVGIAAVSAEHYAGSHWLASFATYLTTQRGIRSFEGTP